MYRLTRTNGDFYASIPSNVILGPNTPSTSPAPINLIGRNKVSYGEAQNENFLWLVENFSSNTAPAAPVKGQLWYDYTNDANTGSGGELKIAPHDNAVNAEWLTVPVIAETNIEPSRSHTGRLIIYKKDRFKIRMNDAWHTVVTEVPQDKLLQTLLDQRNNNDAVDGVNTTVLLSGSSDFVIAKFNEGGYLQPDGTIGGVTEGVLKYGAVYQWEADIVGRRADNAAVYKIWKLKGAFTVGTASVQTGDALTPDPRRVAIFNRNELNYEIIKETAGTESWDVYAASSEMFPDASADTSAILDGDFYGLDFIANAGLLGSGNVVTQWSVFLRMTGLPASTHPNYTS